ncbi:C2H2 and C2HC zinc finger [Glarea lozoyensis ATCC 20868]|uniref:C2H2 and C2HC zinc finger n=1 Tax=Glarea lozoyensis (strain ATCC 20868 / MF5171) TaxID=1116229 RepID=S3D3I6_GLAL2|nr:C2H2 and C2HC zinc finger [Glarea lozoyensis ATCC 20868]EPE32325.1 C2H2 and C2HC zinc finger [Glarea lozoyensis ATCC 20868]
MSLQSEKNLSCAACQISLVDRESQRKHNQSDWHVYNLKRRIAELPSLSLEDFENKVKPARLAEASVEASGFSRTCLACAKSYHNPKSWDNHCKTLSHAKKTEESPSKNSSSPTTAELSDKGLDYEGEDEGEDEISGEADAEFDPADCLFCDIQSSDPESNIQHMHKAHGLFIPDQDRLTDIETFLAYLHTIIADFHECLYCGSTKSTTEATRSHMRDRGHCMLNFDSEGELSMFWEQSDEASSTEANKASSIDDNGLHLPSGKTLVHRNGPRQQSQQSTYSKPGSSPTRKAITDGSTSTGTTTDPRTQLQVTTRAHGGTGLIGVSQLQRRALIANEMSTRKLELKAKNKYARNLDRSTNKTAMKHYRAVERKTRETPI